MLKIHQNIIRLWVKKFNNNEPLFFKNIKDYKKHPIHTSKEIFAKYNKSIDRWKNFHCIKGIFFLYIYSVISTLWKYGWNTDDTVWTINQRINWSEEQKDKRSNRHWTFGMYHFIPSDFLIISIFVVYRFWISTRHQ